MSEYELKPVEVDAKQVSWDTADEIAKWCGGMVVTEYDPNDKSKTFPGINVPTLSGMVRASEGDYVVHFGGGRFQKRSRYAFESEFQKKAEQ